MCDITDRSSVQNIHTRHAWSDHAWVVKHWKIEFIWIIEVHTGKSEGLAQVSPRSREGKGTELTASRNAFLNAFLTLSGSAGSKQSERKTRIDLSPVGRTSKLHRAIRIRSKDLLQTMLRLHLCPEGRCAELNSECPLPK